MSTFASNAERMKLPKAGGADSWNLRAGRLLWFAGDQFIDPLPGSLDGCFSGRQTGKLIVTESDPDRPLSGIVLPQLDGTFSPFASHYVPWQFRAEAVVVMMAI